VKILVTGDVVLDVNVDIIGRRLTPNSNAPGKHVTGTTERATIAHTLLRRLPGMKTNPCTDLGLMISRDKLDRLHWLERVE
jgi:hypothetical protein